ncbi:aminotransferase class I/II-fold pyridoxal phosphate-dependent enzyme [Gemmatimonadota bacterium]
MSISQIAGSVSESATLALNEKAAVLRAKGEPLIHLGGGEPKAKAPMDALLAAAAMLNSGEIRYTPSAGTPAMKAAIIRYTQEYYGRKVTAKHVIASSGAKQAIMVALRAILDPLDEVVFPAPYWVSYPEMVRLCGAVPVPAVPEDGSLIPTAEDIISRVGSQTKAIMINSPSNPSGLMIPPEVIKEVVQFCEKEGLYLITDDIYHRLVFDGKKWTNPCEFARNLGDKSKLIVINGVSKAYAMTGFRIGWAVANPKLIEVMSNIQSHETSGPAGLLQAGAVAAINGVQSSVENLRMQLENRKNILMSKLKAFDGVKVTEPDGTFYAFVDFRAYEKSSLKLSSLILDKVQVVTVPGVAFGMEGHLRISYCGPEKDVIEGIERIKWAVDPNSPNELLLGNRKLIRDWA